MPATDRDAPLADAQPRLDLDARRRILARVLAAPTTAADDLAVPEPGRSPGARRHRTVAAAAAVVVGAAVVVPLEFGPRGPTPSSTGTEIHLASYTFRLPSGYRALRQDDHRPAARALSSCHPGVIATFPVGSTVPSFDDKPDEPGVVSAANAAGGCISMALIGPFTPGGPETPTIAGVGGPNDTAEPASQAIRVGPYQALVGSWKMLGWSTQGTPAPAPWNGETELVVDVSLPEPGGQVDNLVVTSTELSQSALIALVRSGLTATSGSSTATGRTATAESTTPGFGAASATAGS
jgi:hypothetical protein